MIETSRYFRAVPVYLPAIESPKNFKKYQSTTDEQNTICYPRHNTNYFSTRNLPTSDTKIKELRSNNPFNKPIPGQSRQTKSNYNYQTMYGEELKPAFKPSRRLVDIQNPFERKVLVACNQDITTSYLKYLNPSSKQITGSPKYPHPSDIGLDDFPLNLNEENNAPQNISNIGSRIPLKPTPVFNPELQSDHQDVDLRQLQKQINFSGQTFKLVNLKKATKL